MKFVRILYNWVSERSSFFFIQTLFLCNHGNSSNSRINHILYWIYMSTEITHNFIVNWHISNYDTVYLFEVLLTLEIHFFCIKKKKHQTTKITWMNTKWREKKERITIQLNKMLRYKLYNFLMLSTVCFIHQDEKCCCMQRKFIHEIPMI